MTAPREPLPIDPVLPELVAALRQHPCAVLRAPTGAGKTTRVPPALLAAGIAGQRQIVMLQPRRLAVTPGILLRLLHDDPYLESTSVIIFDEFHERGLESDLALGMVRLVQQTVRPDLRLVVMSATIEAEAVAGYLGGCPVVASEGR